MSEWVLPQHRDKSTGHDVFLLPVVRGLRATTIDNLVFRDASGTRISTCNTNDYVVVIGQLLSRVVHTLCGPDTWQTEKSRFARLIDAVLLDVRFDARSEDSDVTGEAPTFEPKSIRELVQAIRSLRKPETWATQAAWETWIDVTCLFCEALTGSYIIFVPVSGRPGDRVTVQHSYTHRNRPERPELIDKARWLFGLRPHEHEFRIFGHAFTPSFHLTFRPPQDQYVYETAVSRTGSFTAQNVVSQPYDGAGARDYAHVWVRPYEAMTNERRANLHLRFDCREKPPGLLGVVTLVAVAQFAFIWVIGKFYGEFFPVIDHATALACKIAVTGKAEIIREAALKTCAGTTASRTASTDIPALLLALPGAAAAWLGAQFTTERIRSTSLSTVSGIFCCGLIAVISTAAAMTRSAGHLVGAQLGVPHIVWAVLMAVSFVLAVDLCARTWVRAHRFANCLKLQNEETSILV